MSGADSTPFVRPYMLTRGRTRPQGAPLPLEALVSTPPGRPPGAHGLGHEAEAIVALCRSRALSVAEVAARIGVPLGVARVLIGDLAQQHHVEVTSPDDTPDVSLLKEVLHGLLVDQ